MAIALRGSAMVPAGNPTTSFTFTIDAAVADGDILVLVVASRGAGALDQPSVTDNDTGGNAWQLTTTSVDYKLTVWWKRATSGTAGKTVTVSNLINSSAGVCKAFSGCIGSGDPVDNATMTNERNASADETHAGITPSQADSMLCAFVVNYANDNAVTSLSFATLGATTMTEKLSTGGLDCAAAFGHKLQTGGPSATGNLTWAQADGTTVSRVLALKPAAATQPLTNAGAIASGEAFGTATVTPGTRTLTAAGAIASGEAFGTATIAPGPVTLTNAGAIATAEAFGTATVAQVQAVTGAGAIPSASAFGTATVTPGTRTLTNAGAIASSEAFGAATVNRGPVAVTNAGGIASAEALGTATVTPGVRTITAAGAVATAEAFGAATVTAGSGTQTITGAGGITSAEAFGTASVSQTIAGESPIGGAQWWTTAEEREREVDSAGRQRRRRARGSLLVMRFFHE